MIDECAERVVEVEAVLCKTSIKQRSRVTMNVFFVAQTSVVRYSQVFRCLQKQEKIYEIRIAVFSDEQQGLY